MSQVVNAGGIRLSLVEEDEMSEVFAGTRTGYPTASVSRHPRGRRVLAAMALAVGVTACVQAAPAVANPGTPLFPQGNAPTFSPDELRRRRLLAPRRGRDRGSQP